jgi:uncharacterized protein with GYD domain
MQARRQLQVEGEGTNAANPEGSSMAYYMYTANYTREAIQAMVKQPQDREAPVRKTIEAAGGKLLHAFVVLGASDVVVLCEFPDDVSMVAVGLAAAASGAVSNGATTKLLTFAQFAESMKKAGQVAKAYKPPQA